ncbi:Asp23/Gls24 family envelope stress response protein [Streptomyces coeruleorubidus]|uniref:Asp23/Gls24 family envelope stress response protein n=1 Tax=Streptomyces coeruleorubidus TaxID=116188 RepID=UPI0033C7187E
MTETTQRRNTAPGAGKQDAGSAQQGRRGDGSAPPETRGSTAIADTVVAKIAGMAAREIPEVHNLGGGMTRAFGAVRQRVPGGGTGVTQGVKVEVGERQAAVDLDVVVEYGAAIADTSADIRTNVINAVERMTGLEVVEVNIAVDDVHLPDEEDEGEGEGESEREGRRVA